MLDIDADAENTQMNKTKILSTFMSLSTLSPSPYLQALSARPILHSSFWFYLFAHILTDDHLEGVFILYDLEAFDIVPFSWNIFLVFWDTTHPLGFFLLPVLFHLLPTLLDH